LLFCILTASQGHCHSLLLLGPLHRCMCLVPSCPLFPLSTGSREGYSALAIPLLSPLSLCSLLKHLEPPARLPFLPFDKPTTSPFPLPPFSSWDSWLGPVLALGQRRLRSSLLCPCPGTSLSYQGLFRPCVGQVRLRPYCQAQTPIWQHKEGAPFGVAAMALSLFTNPMSSISRRLGLYPPRQASLTPSCPTGGREHGACGVCHISQGT
jgi:hypothetical protein